MNRKLALLVPFVVVWVSVGTFVAEAHTHAARRAAPNATADIPALDQAGQPGCSVRYAPAPDDGLRLAVNLAQPGSLDVRVTADDGNHDTEQTEPAGTSVLTVPVPLQRLKALSATLFTADGELLLCGIAPGA